MSDNTQQFMKRFKSAKALRSQWESQLRETYDLFLPNRQGFDNESKGQSKTDQLYTDIGVQALTQFSNNIKTKLMPSQQRWAKLEPSGNFSVDLKRGLVSEEQRVAIQEGLDIDTEVMFYHIWGSNFDSVAVESIKDMGISVGAFMIQDTGDIDAPLNFVSVPADQLSIEEASDGKIKSAWREWTIKAREIDYMWSERKEDARLTKLIHDKPEQDVKVIEGTVYNQDTGMYDYMVHVNVSDCKIIYEDEYVISPWVIFRWDSAPQETWGRGVAMSSKHTMGMLNQLEKDTATARAQAIDPVAVINPDAIINPHKVSFQAGSRIMKTPNWNGEQANSKAVEYLSTGSNFNVSENARAVYEAEIKDAFYLMQLPSVTDGTKTATEYNIRANQALEQQNSAFTRLQKELIEQTIARVYYILSRYGIVTTHEMDGKVISVKATSPLAMYQDSKDIQDIQSFIGNMVNTFGPEMGYELVRKEIDLENIGSAIADKMGLPVDIRLSGDKRLAVENQIAQEKQQAQQQAMLEQQQNIPQSQVEAP